MSLKTLVIIFFLAIFHSIDVKAQDWKIKSYSAGLRIFEVTSVGNTPFTITPLLKDPVSYQNYLNTLTTNILYGNPQIMRLQTFYINSEWQKDNTLSRFWKKTTIQAGLLITKKISQSAGSIGNEMFVTSPDTILYRNMFSLTKNQQFFGANMGLNRRFTISKKITFLTGFHAQGSFAFVHHYQQSLDSITYKLRTERIIKSTHLPNLKGKTFFQWQLMVPIGLEFEFVKDKFLIRMELNAGIIGSNYRPKTDNAKEAHGAGIWLIYKPKQTEKRNSRK